MNVLASLSSVAGAADTAAGAAAFAETADADAAAPESDAGRCRNEFSWTAATPGTARTAFASRAFTVIAMPPYATGNEPRVLAEGIAAVIFACVSAMTA